MATALTLVNRVLRRLRENQVTAFTNPLPLLLLEFLNETKEEVENAWKWTFLRSNYTFQTVSGTTEYTLSGSGKRPIVSSVWNDTSKFEITQITDEYYKMLTMTTSIQPGSPYHYRFRGLSNEDTMITLFPTPNAVEDISVDIYKPEGELTDTSSSTILPARALVLGTWAKAISERGEDGGQNFSEADAFYRSALADAVALDAGKVYWETNWEVC